MQFLVYENILLMFLLQTSSFGATDTPVLDFWWTGPGLANENTLELLEMLTYWRAINPHEAAFIDLIM